MENYNQAVVGGELHLEQAQGIEYSIRDYPLSQLLAVEDTADFIRECFYKILDRPIEEPQLKEYFLQLTQHGLDRRTFIQRIYQSAERKEKHTQINFEK